MSNPNAINSNNSYKFSFKEKDYNGGNNKSFDVRSFPVSGLKELFTNHNFSTIEWKNGQRKKENFVSASGFIIDIDKEATIKEAESKLKHKSLNYALITSKSHTDELNKFHIFLPFDKSINDLFVYESTVKQVRNELFPKSDESVTDGARFIFGSPQDAHYSCCFDNKPIRTKDYVDTTWTDDLEITLSSGEKVLAVEIGSKEIIHCPFHEDANPSAFIDISENSGNHFIHCSSCNKTFWREPNEDQLEVKCKNYWSHRDSVYQAGLTNNNFSFQKIGKEKFFVLTNSNTKEEKEAIFRYLVKGKHLHNLERVEVTSDMNLDQSTYDVDLYSGIIRVRIAPIPVKIKDNKFIDNYLQSVFGEHTEFIKQWLAAYCYTNYTKLPHLVLIGKRGTGKNTFAEPIGDIFESLSDIVGDLNANFNPSLEKKLLIVDESLSNGKIQYVYLKKLSGQKNLEINKKYVPQYQTRNNINLILLSNEENPIFVAREEAPKDEKSNQFFVYKMKNTFGEYDIEFKEKILDRLGHYIRTELKAVFDNINPSGNRYYISTPITEEEKALFATSTTDAEYVADQYVEAITTKITDKLLDYHLFIQDELLPKNLFDEVEIKSRVSQNEIVRNLQSRDYITKENPIKKQVQGKRCYCYKLGPKWLDEIKKDEPLV